MSLMDIAPWVLPLGGMAVLLALALRPWLPGNRQGLAHLPGLGEAVGERTEATAHRLEEEAEELEYDHLTGKVDDASYQERLEALSRVRRSLTELEREAETAVRRAGGPS